jgi:putative flippase GtrA
MTISQSSAQKIRFGAVGALNSLIDFGLFLSLSLGGMPALAANYVSTSVALTFSFFANKKYTFKAEGGNYTKQLILFFAFTTFGLWILQPVIIFLVESLLSSLALDRWLDLTIAKVVATGVTLVWNYLTYSRFVFKANP